jgi:hypothetical protein
MVREAFPQAQAVLVNRTGRFNQPLLLDPHEFVQHHPPRRAVAQERMLGTPDPVMIANVAIACREFAKSEDKLEWLKNRLAWQTFHRRLAKEAVRNAAFDAAHATDTASELDLEHAGLTSTQAKRGNTIYRVFWEDNFAAVLDDLQIHHPEFTFVDIGSGKGKLLLLASHYPFRQIVGVELAPLLHEIAIHNIAVYRSPRQRCTDILSKLADALAYELPAGPLVCLMVNPFDRATVERVVGRIAEQRRTSTDPVLVIYANMRRVDEIGAAFDDIKGLEVMLRRHNHIILGNLAAVRAGAVRMGRA